MKRNGLVSAVLLMQLGVAATALAQPLVVSIGDSYASGEGAPDQSGPFAQHPIWRGDNTDGLASYCHRSALAAPAQAATSLGMQFGSTACSGSVTYGGSSTPAAKQLLGPGGQLSTIASRFAGQSIDALLVSIGGNDIGFAPLLQACVDPSIPDCRIYGDMVNAALLNLPAALDAVTNAVNTGAAGAVRHVFLTEYPDPTSGPYGVCASTLITLAGLTKEEATWASVAVVAPLNRALADAIDRANINAGLLGGSRPRWHFVSGISASYATHGYCTGPGTITPFTPRYLNTVEDSLAVQGDIMGTMHPNFDGQAATRDVLVDQIGYLNWFPRPDGLAPGDVLTPGQFIRSSNGWVTLILQGDGNLVLYGPQGALRTWGQAANFAVMQEDGNFVLYGPGGALWDSVTYGHPGAFLLVQDDGNLVIYAGDGTPLWATNTFIPPCNFYWCSGVCTNLSDNDANCGACGVVCSSGMVCGGGTCVVPEPEPNLCPVGRSDCCGTGTCLTTTQCINLGCL